MHVQLIAVLDDVKCNGSSNRTASADCFHQCVVWSEMTLSVMDIMAHLFWKGFQEII